MLLASGIPYFVVLFALRGVAADTNATFTVFGGDAGLGGGPIMGIMFGVIAVVVGILLLHKQISNAIRSLLRRWHGELEREPSICQMPTEDVDSAPMPMEDVDSASMPTEDDESAPVPDQDVKPVE